MGASRLPFKGRSRAVWVVPSLKLLPPPKSQIDRPTPISYVYVPFPDPEIPESRPVPPRFGPGPAGKWPGSSRSRLGRDRENIRDFAPIPIRPGSREIGESRFGRDRELAGICASINRDQDRDRDPGFHFLVVQFWDWSSRNAGFPPLGQRRNGTSTRSSS